MFNIVGLGIKNLRSLQDTGVVDIRPITILVGKNSAGKSTFARTFPLLKQSAERRKQTPILWFGRLVDFGSFDESVSSFASPKHIEFTFRFTTPSAIAFSPREPRAYTVRSDSIDSAGTIDVTITLAEESEERTKLLGVQLSVFGTSISLLFETDIALTVNNKTISVPQQGKFVRLQGSILPQLRLFFPEGDASSSSDTEFTARVRRQRLGEREVINVISRFVHGNTLDEKKVEIADRLPLATSEALLQKCKTLSSVPDSWRSAVRSWSENHSYLLQLRDALLLFKLQPLLTELDEMLATFCANITYLEPLRATAQRYYRREEVSVDSIDSKGLNTAFFIQSLSLTEKASLNRWLSEAFGFEVSAKVDRGHTSLEITDKTVGTSPMNMADVGLGYSQLLPVALQLWASRTPPRQAGSGLRAQLPRNIRFDRRPVVVVEQPELHLHPAFQASLADLLARCVKPVKAFGEAERLESPLRIIAETHSSSLISRLGELVGNGLIDPDLISILLFEPSSTQTGASNIRRAFFDSAGRLKNWPIGFFDA